MLEPGTVLQGRYIVERVLGQGGMATVYLARHAVITERLVAVKETVLPTLDLEERERVIDLFNKEAKLLARLDHPSLVQVSDFFQEGDSQFLVMTFVDGKTLDHVVGERDALPSPREVLRWSDQIVEVLTYLHAQSPPVIYRDLKPSNMMLDKNGKIWILDFGIAREAETGSKTATALKGFGTPGYAPPEQFGRSTTDARSDIYSVGATLYALLTGERPPVSVDLMMGDAKLTPPAQLNPEIQPALERAILKMMALRKEERYQSMAEVREVLRAIPIDAKPGELRMRSAPIPGMSAPAAGGAFPAPSFPRPPAFPSAAGGSFPSAPSFPSAAGRDLKPLRPGGLDTSSKMKPASAPPPPLLPLQVPSTLDVAKAKAMPQTATPSRFGPPPPLPEEAPPPQALVAHGVWVTGIIVFILCMALAGVCVMNKRIPGLLFLPTMIVYPVAQYLMFPFGPRMVLLGGSILQFAIPLGLGAVLFMRKQVFWSYVCLFAAAQGLVSLGVDLANGAGSGIAADWKILTGLANMGQMGRMGEAFRMVGLLAMLSPLLYMARWIWAGRPRPTKDDMVF